MQDKKLFKIAFSARDLKGDYCNNEDCPVARATKRFFKWKYFVNVGPITIFMHDKRNVISVTQAKTLSIERVVLNRHTIAYGGGFGNAELEKLRVAFARNPYATAHIMVRYR